MSLDNNMLVTFDGASKCGKTTVVGHVKEEALYQKRFLSGDLLHGHFESMAETPENIWYANAVINNNFSGYCFDRITTISAGNMFRAAALHFMRRKTNGRSTSSFSEADKDPILELLMEEGVIEELQTDPEIGIKVSEVAQVTGVQALCGTIFTAFVREKYFEGDGGNLVIADARDPVAHLLRDDIIGTKPDQINPNSVLPTYIETSSETAASRMEGDYEKNLALVKARRHLDETRADHPVRKPEQLIQDFEEWADQLDPHITRESGVILPYELNNNKLSLEHIQRYAGHVAKLATNTAIENSGNGTFDTFEPVR